MTNETTLTGHTHDGLVISETFPSLEDALAAALNLVDAQVIRERHVVAFKDGRVVRNRRLPIATPDALSA